MGGKRLVRSKSDPRCSWPRNSRNKSKNRKTTQGKNKTSGENLSFSGCGFLGIYHVGVASCFHEYAPQISMNKIAGASAGALVAAAHICGNIELAEATSEILRIAIDARSRTLGPLHPSFDVNAIIREALERGLPDDVHIRTSGKLHISLTRVYDGENVVVSKFDSKEEVIQALICTCFIPLWSGFVAPKFKGVSYIDGGFSKNLLILDDKTVTVSPFAGEADICPQDDVYNLLTVDMNGTSISLTPNNLHRLALALLPPRPEVLSELCERGFADGIRYLQRMKLISCIKCLEIRSTSVIETQIIEQTVTFRDRRRKSTISYDETQNIIEEDEFIQDDNCDGCILRRNNAHGDPMPTLFTDRIREACDNFNKSLMNWLYSHRPIKYLSYLAAPCYLPLEISLKLLMKYSRLLPFIGIELVKSAIELAKRIHERSTTSLLMPPNLSLLEDDKTAVRQQEQQQQQQQQHQQTTGEAAISVKFTADRRKSVQSLTTYECCLTIAVCGQEISTITNF